MLNEYHNAVRDTIVLLKKRGQANSMLLHEIKQDEQYDPTLVSLRVYKSRKFADVIRVACGVSHAGEPLPLQLIYLPPLAQIIGLKNKYGVN